MTTQTKPAAIEAAGSIAGAHSWQATRTQYRPETSPVQAALSGGPLVHCALVLARAGFRPVPMLSHAKRPALKGWRERASLDAAEVERTFAAAPHADGIAIATGDAVFVADLDRGHGDGADGIGSFAQIAREHPRLPAGPRTRTPNGGLHLYLAHPPGVRIRNKCGLAPGVDVRGEGGLAMCAPSALRDGRRWRWIDAPWAVAIPMAPDWLLALVSPPPRPMPASAPPRPFSGHVSAYVRAAFERECAAVAKAKPGTRNAALFAAACKLGSLAASGALPADAVANALYASAETSGLVADDGLYAVEATIASGFKAGLARPRALPSPHGRRT